MAAPAPAPAVPLDVLRELVRQATLAASSHNTQPWKFSVTSTGVRIAPDYSRRCAVVDPDDHHLFISLGCAAENLCIAAEASGWHADVTVRDTVIDAALQPATPLRSPLAQAIADRQCTRGLYDSGSLGADERRALDDAAHGPGVHAIMLAERRAMEQVLEFVTRGNAAQLSDAAFVAELQKWVRFNAREAASRADGLFSGSMGNPSIPAWLGKRVFRYVATAKAENDKVAAQIRSSAGIAVFVSDADEPASWVEVGRRYERFALQATALGIRNAFINQAVEVAGLRSEFAAWLGTGNRRPDLVVRYGRGPVMPRSYRRPLADVFS